VRFYPVELGKPVAAQMGSVVILAHAGVLKGKKYTFPADPTMASPGNPVTDTKFVDAVYSGKGVIRDGAIITSGVCPYVEKATKMQGMEGFVDGTPELTKVLITSLKTK